MKKILITCVIAIVALSAILPCFGETNNVTIQKTKNEIDEETPIEITEPEQTEEIISQEGEKVSKGAFYQHLLSFGVNGLILAKA